jgi:hypothetical protein
VLPNYSQASLPETTVNWSLLNDQEAVISSGSIRCKELKQGEVNQVGEIEIRLSQLNEAQKLSLQLSVESLGIMNDYPVWVYPHNLESEPHDIEIALDLNAKLISRLEKGAKVLYMPTMKSIEDKSVANQFISEFWNWGMFTSLARQFGRQVSPGTMGLLMDPEHPVFNYFPTQFHTDWQWWSIVKQSRSFILDDTDDTYRPMVQIIDNINRNHKLGLLFEYRVGKGNLLICTSELEKINTPEAKQLLHSIIEYMKTDAFDPAFELSVEDLQGMFL